MQQTANQKSNIANAATSHGVPVYTGSVCRKDRVNRSGSCKTLESEYPEQLWPFYCTGPLSIYSATFLDKINKQCPYHCIGLTDKSNFLANSTCFYKFEDVFFGSCLSTMSNVFSSGIGKSMWNFLIAVRNRRKLRSGDNVYVVHTNLNSGIKTMNGTKNKTKDSNARLDNGMLRIHELYSNLDQIKTFVPRQT